MSRLIGEAYISLLADGSLFRADADAKVNAVIKSMRPTIQVRGDFGDVDKKVAALAATLKGLKGTVTLDSRGFLKSVDEMETAVLELMDRLDDIPADINDSKMLAKLYGARGVVNDLAERLENIDADTDTDKLLSKIYGAISTVEDLETLASHIDVNGDISKMEAKIATLVGGASELSAELEHMRATVEDSAALAKIATMQAAVLKFTKSLRNLPVTADTLPFEASLFKLMAQVEALHKAAAKVEVAPILPYMLPGGGRKGASPFEFGTMNTGSYTNSEAHGMDLLAMQTLNASRAMRSFNQDLKFVEPTAGRAAMALERIAGTQSMFIKSNIGGWWGAWNTKIRLMGGALDSILPKWSRAISLWHLGLDVLFEIAAAWAPALIAVGAFAAYAIPVGQKIFSQWKNINTVLDSVGSSTLPDLGSQFDTIQKHIEPSVLIAFGEYMQVIGKNGQALGTVLAGVGKVVDVWGAAFVNWADKATKGFDNIVHSGTGSFALIGEGFHQLFRILGMLVHDMPGIVHVLLPLGDAFLKVTGNVISALGPVIKFGLLLHGILIYAGLAVTAVVALGRAITAAAIGSFLSKTGGLAVAGEQAATASGKFSKLGVALGAFAGNAAAGVVNTFRYSKGLFTLGEDAAKTGAKARIASAGTKLLGDGLKLVSLIPVAGWAGIAAVAIGTVLYFALKHGTDAAAQFNKEMQSIVVSSNVVNIQRNLATAITQTTQAMNQLHRQMAVAPGGLNRGTALQHQAQLAAGNQQQSSYSQGLSQLIGQTDNYGQRLSALSRIFGSTRTAELAMNMAGISAGQIASENNTVWQNQYTQLVALAKGYGYMGQQAGAAGAQLSTLNIASGTTYKNLQALTQAEAGWISMVNSGDSAFTTFEQGQQTLSSAMTKGAKSGATLTVTVGKLREAYKLTGTSLNGTSASALAARQAFDQQLNAGIALYGNLQTLAAASGNTGKAQKQLAIGGKAIIAQMLPFVAGSKEGTFQLSQLARLMGGPATTNFKVLARWVGSTKGSVDKLNNAQRDLTIGMKDVTVAARNLGNTLETTVTQAQAAAIAKSVNLTNATQKLADAAVNAKGKMTAQAVLAAGEYVDSLTKAGLSTHDATQYLNAYLGRLGYGPGVIKQLDNALHTNKSNFESIAGKMGLSKKAADDLFDSLQKLKQNSPYGVKLQEHVNGDGSITARANIPGQPNLTSHLNFLGKARGGVIPGGIHGQDSVPTMLAPGELVIPSSHAAHFGDMAKRAGIPGMASGGFVGDMGSLARQNSQVVPFTTNVQSKFATETMKAFVEAATKAASKALTSNMVHYNPSAGVGQWGPDVLKALALNGLPASLENQVLHQIATESGGNPNAINLTDSNARAGHPSQGLLQTIPSTFSAFHVGGTSSNIRDPLANIAAAVAYAKATYGPTLMRGGAGLGSGHGYSTGGVINEPVYGRGAYSGLPYSFAENGQPEYVSNGSQHRAQSTGGMQGATNQGQQQMIALLQTLIKQNQQLPSVIGKSIGHAGGNGVRHGYYKGQN